MRFTEFIFEAGSPAQQAAIAVAMKKAGKKPKDVAESLPNTDVKKQISKFEELALAANRAGDDAKCKQYQQKIQSLKQKMSQAVTEDSLNELSSGLLQRAAQAATDKRNQAMDPKLHDALGGGYMNPLATHYDNVSQKINNRAGQVRKKETIQKIASKIASPAVMRKMGMSEQGVAEGLGKQIHGTFQSMGDSFSDAHLAKGISYFLQGRHQEGENMLRSKIPEKAQNIVFSKLKTLQAQSGLDVNKNPNIQKYIDDELVPWVKRQIQQGVAEDESNDTAISLSKLGKFHPGTDTLAEFVPERATAQYALHPDKWESTFYSLTNKDSDKLKYYGPKKISIPPGTLVGDMAIANKFYRAKTPEEQEQYAELYKASLQPYPVDVSQYRMPELLIPKQGMAEEWSKKYKSSINCSHPKGFSQKAHCAGKKKHNESIMMEMVCEDCGMCQTHGDHENLDEACWKGYHKEGNKKMFGKTYPNCVKNTNEEQLDEKCWDTHKQVGMKNKGGRMVPNCVPKESAESTDQVLENLHKWFKEKWVRFGPDGKIRGDCARGSESEGKPKCLPQSKAHSLGKKGRASAASRKRREDPNANRSGKAINVSTKGKGK